MDGWRLQSQTLARVSELYVSVSEGNKSKEGFSHIQGLERNFLNQVRNLSMESGGKGSTKKDFNNQRNLFKDVLEFLENVPPAILLCFLREHRSEWADNIIDAYLAAAVKVGPCSLPRSRVGGFGSQVLLPPAHTIEHEKFLDVIKLEGIAHSPKDAKMPRDIFLLQIVRHAENWNVSALEAIGQIFTPSFGRLYY